MILALKATYSNNNPGASFNRLAASLQDRLFNGLGNAANNGNGSADEEYRKNAANTAHGQSQLPSHSPYEIKTEPGVHLKRSSSPNALNKLPFKKQCTSADYNEGNNSQ